MSQLNSVITMMEYKKMSLDDVIIFYTSQEKEVPQPAYPERRYQKQKASDWRQHGAHTSVHASTLW